MNSRYMRMTSRLLIASVLSLALPLQSTYAVMVETGKVAASAQSQTERERVRTFLDRADVRKELQAQEVHKIAGNLDKMPAGGDVLGVLLTVFIILLITDILGFTKVFPFTRSIK
jgi:hypothetical protein